MKAFVVVDLGFGDAGKGLMTDYLVRQHGVRLVVRFNGGAQAGHTVVETSGRQHTFSQFGSGTFTPGVKTHLASPVVVHPTALQVEADRLSALGERDALERLSIDPACRVTTPFQQAAARLRELLRGGARHGSCGVGFGETVADSLQTPELVIRFGELCNPSRVRARLFEQRTRKLREFAPLLTSAPASDLARELELLQSEKAADRWLRAASEIANRVALKGDEVLQAAPGVIVFEGAQGVLLDEQVGFHPFTTYSRCTPHAALELLSRVGFSGQVETLGVLRAYAVRHGPGPLPTEDPLVSERTREPHNQRGVWQGPVRKGWLDLALLDYALRAAAHIDALVVTHLDSLRAFETYRWCTRYTTPSPLRLPADLSEQASLAASLASAEPLYTTTRAFAAGIAPQNFFRLIRDHFGIDAKYGSIGPTAGDVFQADRG